MRKEPQITSECPSLTLNLEICSNGLNFIDLREVLQKLKGIKEIKAIVVFWENTL